MSNRCYLVGTDAPTIYPSFVNKPFEPEKDTYLASAGCVPLAWLLLFRPGDLVTAAFEPEGEKIEVTAPIVRKEKAIANLSEARAWVDPLFVANGGLGYHLDLFVEHLAGSDHQHLTMEIEEIEALHDDGEVLGHLRACLTALEARDPRVKEELVWLSTVLVERRFVTLEDAQEGRAEKEDQWNFFRLLGEGWEREAAWD